MNEHKKLDFQFTDSQIDLAIQLKHSGLAWQPGIGQYAYDHSEIIEHGSPFQHGVYFFLNFPCFIEYFGSLSRLTESMVWLPTWEQARTEAARLNIPLKKIEEVCLNGLEQNAELESIYTLLLTGLKSES